MTISIVAALLALASAAPAQTRVPVAAGPAAPAEERLAAAELARYLPSIYSGVRFPVVERAPAGAPRILVGTLRGNPELAGLAAKEKLAQPESFLIARSGDTGIVAGADARGVLSGVYALLEKLGCGFYLSYDATPARPRPFSLDGWELAGAPLYGDRIVFNWHNFLSSGSSWEAEDWQRWIDQSAKMRFNTIMVHAYGNNPMFSFRYHGQEKPVGYLATTARGRDWGTQHVNDVRRLIAGEIFSSAVFGSSAARAPEAERVPAATALMKKVFAHARSRAMHVTFALDVDTESANPQNIIKTLPPAARIAQGSLQLANPDTPEGYDYYRAQVRQLLNLYPQIDRLAVWFRASRTPWRDLKPAEFPAAWKREFAALCERDPELASDKDAPGIFAVSRLVRAFGKALRDIGRADVQLATGSWRLEFIPLADRFMPLEAAIIPLDWNTSFESETARRLVRNVQPGRKVVPIVWAHHDDRTYIGRPYTPYASFASLLEAANAAGFGIIHWTTRPLDLYFKSLADQVWSPSANQPLRTACERMAERSFGGSAAAVAAEYLERWITEAPMFGRETGNRFIDVALRQPETAIAAMRARLGLLSKIDAASLSPAARDRLEYHADYERFMLSFFESQHAFEHAGELLARGALEDARRTIAASRPEETVRLYAQAARHGGMTRGEEALLISLNLRWVPYIVSLRQALALEPVRLKFGPTQHEPLAQGAGANTFYFDPERRLWKVMGQKETNTPAFENPQAREEMRRSGIRLERPLTLRIAPLAGGKLAPGRYALELFFAQPPDTRDVLMQIEVAGESVRVPLRPAMRYEAEVTGGALEVTFRPVRGPGYLVGAVLSPVR